MDKLDFLINKLLPKKFIIVIFAGILTILKIMPGDIFGYIVITYIGGNIAGKFSPNKFTTPLQPPGVQGK